MVASTLGENASVSHPVAVNGAETVTFWPLSDSNWPVPVLASHVSGLRMNFARSIFRSSWRMRIGMPARIVGSLSAPTLSRPILPPSWRSLTASSLMIVVPRSNGPAFAGTTTVIRASSPSPPGSEKYTFPGVWIGLPPLPTWMSTVPIWLAAGQSPARALSRGHSGTVPSAPSRPSGSATLAATRLSERSASLMVVVRLVSCAAVNGSESSDSSGWKPRGPEHGALGAATVVIESSGWAAGGVAPIVLASPRAADHGTSSPRYLWSPQLDGLTSGAKSPPGNACSTWKTGSWGRSSKTALISPVCSFAVAMPWNFTRRRPPLVSSAKMRNWFGWPATCGPAQTSPPIGSRLPPGFSVAQSAGTKRFWRFAHGSSGSTPVQPKWAYTNGLTFEQVVNVVQGTGPVSPSARGVTAKRSAICEPFGQLADSNAPRSNCSGEQVVKPGRPARAGDRLVFFRRRWISL